MTGGTIASAYLSRVIISRNDAKEPYAVHRLLWRAHAKGNETNTMKQPFLFREEPFAPIRCNNEVAFSVQSSLEPQWSDALGVRVVSSTRVETEFLPNQSFYFRLLASPVRRLMSPEAIMARGHQCVSRQPPAEWTQAWIEKRAKDSGFMITELIFDLSKVQVRRDRRVFTLKSVQFDGQLQVTNPDAFAQAWSDGIGTKKAFGFGLLSLQRA